MSKLFFAAAAVAAFGFAGQALAADQAAPAQVVHAGNVNFHDQAAVKAFYVKLYRTAEAVCDSNSANPVFTQQDQLCVQRALANAVQSANRPMLTAMYRNSADQNRGFATGY